MMVIQPGDKFSSNRSGRVLEVLSVNDRNFVRFLFDGEPCCMPLFRSNGMVWAHSFEEKINTGFTVIESAAKAEGRS